jgi:hypothetical protein
MRRKAVVHVRPAQISVESDLAIQRSGLPRQRSSASNENTPLGLVAAPFASPKSGT